MSGTPSGGIFYVPPSGVHQAMSSGSSQQKTYPPFRSTVVQGLLILGAMVAVFLAGSVRQGATGIFLVVAGVAMVFLAPNRIVPRRYWILSGGLLLCASTSLLPQAWFYAPPWRLSLQALPGLPALPALSLVPRESGYWLIILASALLIGLFSIGHPLRSNVKIYLGLLGTLACATYASVAIYAKTTGWEYPFFDKGGWAPPDFGFFPNRNHTAALLVTGSILAMGIIREAWSSKKRVVFLLGGAALAICVYSLLFYSMSRGGVVFLLLGTVVWVGALGGSHRSLPLVITSLAIAIALLFYFFAADGMSKNRLLEMVGIQSTVAKVGTGSPRVIATATTDKRTKVFQDTARMIWDYPLTGTGLGTYAFVYPFYARKSIGEAGAVHPESDWMMIAAESGLPCLICAMLLLGVLLRDMWKLRRSQTWSLRWGIICGALVAILHGLVDVPLHRVELGWWVLVLAGLAFGYPTPSQTEGDTQKILQRWVFGIGGGAIFAMGGLLVGAQWFSLPPFPPYRAGIVLDQMRQLSAVGNGAEAVKLGRAEISRSLMTRGIYREMGQRILKTGGDPVEVDAMFAIERAMNPVSAKIPLAQSQLWLRKDPLRAAKLWGEALQKDLAIENGGGHGNTSDMFRGIIGETRQNPSLAAVLGTYARTSPKAWFTWMPVAPKGSIEEASKDAQFLAMLDDEEQRKFLLTWNNVGDRQAMESFLAANPKWNDAAWPLRVRQLIEKKDFQAVVLATQERYAIDLKLPEPKNSEETSMSLAETVATLAMRGNLVSARRMIQESVQVKEPEGLRLQCILAMMSNDWASAWKSMDAYLRETNRGNLP
ncbi:MAG: O-antigen ligase family protein [Verrucomicrobia bacterium]|nr:O-antigen ligase family protein [Verrucomicrobiota bacterium]